jgi:hypothetical protein
VVLPPYLLVSPPGLGIEPRQPQTLILIATALSVQKRPRQSR